MIEIGRLPCAWGRYDDVAEPYERFQASNGYARLARDLVTALNLTPGASLLDLGCDSGTLAAQQAVGVQGPRRGTRHLAAHAAPSLCHRRLTPDDTEHQGNPALRRPSLYVLGTSAIASHPLRGLPTTVVWVASTWKGAAYGLCTLSSPGGEPPHAGGCERSNAAQLYCLL